MSVKELIVRARAQVKSLDTLGALRTMRHIRQMSPETQNVDDLWDALQFHVKVLRLLDERSQIPAVIQAYLGMGHFLDAPKSSGEMRKYLTRAHDIARLYWNYDTPEKAILVLDKIIATNESQKTDFALGPALVVRARIAEQARDFKTAIPLMDKALNSKIAQDLVVDLLWRKVFLQLDSLSASGASAASVLPLLEPLRKFASRDATEKGRWHYWYGQVLVLAKKNDEALKHFEEAYKADPFSYYSDMSGLELLKAGKKPKDWTLGAAAGENRVYEKRSWRNPDWEFYFSDNGHLQDASYKDLAHVYFLSKIGDLQGAERGFADLERLIWARVLSSRIRWESRLRLARDVAWLRTSLGDPMGSLKAAEVARQANAKGFEDEDYLNLYPLPYWPSIQSESSSTGINPWLAASLIRQESAFNAKARSWANAIGLMQMIPPVASEEAKLIGIQNFAVESLYDPAVALQLGIHHISRLLKTFEDSWICTIASYNAGSPPVIKWIDFYTNEYPATFIERIPFVETRNYVKSILRNFINYQRIYANGEIKMSTILLMPKVVPGTLVSPKKQSASL